MYSGTGNIFILIDGRLALTPEPKNLSRKLCRKHGVDGLLFMECSQKAEIRMRIFNPDGSEAEMCGNGSRCAAHWAHSIAGFRSPFKIETGAGILGAEVSESVVRIKMTDPKNLKSSVKVKVGEQELDACSLDTGVPHVVVPVEQLKALDIIGDGRKIRYDERFKPEGTNVSFFSKEGEGCLAVRTYERGVEGETQSCGTGATACALIASLKFQWPSPVEVRTASREVLKIYFKREGG